MSIPAKTQARLNEIEQHQKLFKQRATDALNHKDYASSTHWQLKILELHIEKDNIYLNYYTQQNSSNKYYWQERLRLHTHQKAEMLGVSQSGISGSAGAQGVAEQPISLSKTDLETKIVSSGLKQALADANVIKNWDEAKRLTALIQKMRAELVWIDYKTATVTAQPVQMSKTELEAKIVSSGLKQALADANAAKNWDEAKRLTALIQKMRAERIWIDYKAAQGTSTSSSQKPLTDEEKITLSKLPHNIKFVEQQYNQEKDSSKKAKYKQQLDRLKAQLADLQQRNGGNDGRTIGNSNNKSGSMQDDDFHKYVASRFMQADPRRKQDAAHNPIITRLLATKFAPKKVVNDPDKAAYDAVRNNINAPLLQIGRQSDIDVTENTFSQAGEEEKKRFPNLSVQNKKVLSTIFIRDFMNIRSTGNLSVRNWLVEDTAAKEKGSKFTDSFNITTRKVQEHVSNDKGKIKPFNGVAHRDAIQLIPYPNSTGSDQLAGAMMSNVTISDNIIASDGELQGIFAADGAFKNLSISNNFLKVTGKHTISISGMLSGSLAGNKNLDSSALRQDKIKLLPLRIGGEANIYINGFTNKPGTPAGQQYKYEPIAGIAPDSPIDTRTKMTGYAASTPEASFYDKVDMQEFHKEYAKQKDKILALRKERKRDELKKAYRGIMETLVQKNFAIRK